jgi:hypothetical protein
MEIGLLWFDDSKKKTLGIARGQRSRLGENVWEREKSSRKSKR